MKVVFLDIDGVLNREGTKERVAGFIGVDAKLAKLFLDWYNEHEVSIILSSTWRQHQEMKDGLSAAGITWIAQTPKLGTIRGEEIRDVVAKMPEIERYAILDDSSDMLPSQRPFFVQTSYVHGLRPRNLRKLDEILGFTT